MNDNEALVLIVALAFSVGVVVGVTAFAWIAKLHEDKKP